MAYKLDITKNFNDDLSDVLSYISHKLHSPVAAKHLLINTEEKVSLIHDNPHLYPVHHKEKLAESGYHYAVVSNYLMFYTIDEANKIIHMARFLYGGQNISDIL